MKPRVRNAFTLIEILIVVVIMAILAATIIPQFTSSTDDGIMRQRRKRSEAPHLKINHGLWACQLWRDAGVWADSGASASKNCPSLIVKVPILEEVGLGAQRRLTFCAINI